MFWLSDRLPEVELSRRNRLIVYYLAGLVVLVLCYTVTYNVLMARLEGVNHTVYCKSLPVVRRDGPANHR